MATKKTPVKKTKKTTDIAKYDYGDDYDAGFENQGMEDTLLKPLKILQAQSPEVLEKTITGAKAGLILDPSTDELFKYLTIIPIYRERVFTEWLPRDKGGGGGSGFVAEHLPDSELILKAIIDNGGKWWPLSHPKNGNDLAESFKLHCIIQEPDGTLRPSMIIFTSSQIKVWQKASTAMRRFDIKGKRPAMYVHLAKISTVVEKNPKGQWFNYRWEPANGEVKNSLIPPKDPRLEAARTWLEIVKQGETKVDYGNVDREMSVDDADADLPF